MGFKSHLYGIEIQRKTSKNFAKILFKSHLYGIEIVLYLHRKTKQNV